MTAQFWLIVAVVIVVICGALIYVEASQSDVPGEPSEPPSDSDSAAKQLQAWTPVAEVDHGPDVHLIAGMLEDRGIPTEAEEDFVHGRYWSGVGSAVADHTLSVFVPNDRADEARRVLLDSPYAGDVNDEKDLSTRSQSF